MGLSLIFVAYVNMLKPISRYLVKGVGYDSAPHGEEVLISTLQTEFLEFLFSRRSFRTHSSSGPPGDLEGFQGQCVHQDPRG